MEIGLAILTGFLLPASLFLFKSYINEKKNNKELKKKIESEEEKKIQMLSDGVCLLMRITIIDYHKRYMHEGSIPLYALENAKTMYSVYSMFGVNGIHDLMEELGDLPIRN